MENIINIDENLCIGCMLCVKDCPALNIKLDKSKAYLVSQNCIKCGHCVAICPKFAVSISGYSQEPYEILEDEKINPKILLNALRFRRSIRQFKDLKIDEKIIKDIIEAGRWTPSAKNAQDVSYVIIKDEIRNVERQAVSLFRKIVSFVKIFKKSIKDFEVDDDFFFKKAPLVIVVVSNNKINASLCASNMALMAESHNLGVLYSGFFAFVANISPSIKSIMGVKGKKIVTALVIGYPNVKYKRTVQRKDAVVLYK